MPSPGRSSARSTPNKTPRKTPNKTPSKRSTRSTPSRRSEATSELQPIPTSPGSELLPPTSPALSRVQGK